MPAPEIVDPELLNFVKNAAQRRIVQACVTHGSQAAAAAALGTSPSNVSGVMSRVKRYAKEQGYSPEHDMLHAAPETHYVKGTSTLYDGEGNQRLQWVKTDARREELIDNIRQACEELAAEYVEGKAKKTKPPKHSDDELLVVYPMGDPHIGMYAWAEEAGEDFDLSVAERDIDAAVSELTRAAPAASTGLIVNLGDFFHADDQSNATPRGKNQLDVDTRYAKVIRTGVRVLVHVVNKALKRHQNVVIRNESGNHDPHSSLWLSIVMDAYYRNEPRVEVVLSPAPFWYWRHGKVLIGTTHGHGPKPKDLPGIMASDRPEDWGATQHRTWIHGHIHTTTRHEYPGCVVESFRTLAGKDFWHTQQGYRAGRDMNALVYHVDEGEIARYRVDISRIRGAAA